MRHRFRLPLLALAVTLSVPALAAPPKARRRQGATSPTSPRRTSRTRTTQPRPAGSRPRSTNRRSPRTMSPDPIGRDQIYRDRRHAHHPRRRRQADRLGLLRRLHRRRREGLCAPPGHLLLQWRPRLLDLVAAHGQLRARARADRQPRIYPPRPLCVRRQPRHAARQVRPRLRRCDRHRLFARARRQEGQGFLGRRPGCRRLRARDHALRHAQRALAVAQSSSSAKATARRARACSPTCCRIAAWRSTA